MNPLGAAYGTVARLRRRWYARHPDALRRLDRPVVSVGNLVVGGSGKTPAVAALAERLRRAGERPAILSRGYARREPARGVLVVSDGSAVLAPVEHSGDEPQMLARALDGVPVLVCPDRYAAGRVAEERFGATVLLLDDGFQHLTLARDVDLLIVSPGDLHEGVLPAGALREPLEAARFADAVLVPAADEEAGRVAAALGVREAFTLQVRGDPPRLVRPYGEPFGSTPPGRVLAVAGIARPDRFFETVRAQGWEVTGTMVFPDHHWFGDRDLRRVEAEARRTGAAIVMTTAKDAVRVGEMSATVPWAYLPIRAAIGPETRFGDWLSDRLATARSGRAGRGVAQP